MRVKSRCHHRVRKLLLHELVIWPKSNKVMIRETPCAQAFIAELLGGPSSGAESAVSVRLQVVSPCPPCPPCHSMLPRKSSSSSNYSLVFKTTESETDLKVSCSLFQTCEIKAMDAILWALMFASLARIIKHKPEN